MAVIWQDGVIRGVPGMPFVPALCARCSRQWLSSGRVEVLRSAAPGVVEWTGVKWQTTLPSSTLDERSERRCRKRETDCGFTSLHNLDDSWLAFWHLTGT